MGNLVASPAGSPNRELATLALDSATWSIEGSNLPAMPDADIPATIAAIKAMIAIPLKDAEPGAIVRDASQAMGFSFEGEATKRLVDAIRPLGIKISPTMSPDQAGAWIAAMIAALGDLPARIAIKAAEAAIHTPMQFMNEVETAIRSKVPGARARYSLAVSRLERLQREMATVALPAPEAPPLTVEGLARAGREIMDMGLKAGFVTQEDFDAAMALRETMEDGHADKGKRRR